MRTSLRRNVAGLSALAALALLFAPSLSAAGEPPELGAPTPLGELVPGSGFGSTSGSDDMDIAAGGGILLAVWHGSLDGAPTLHALRLAPGGTPLDAAPLPLTETADSYSTKPSVAYDGTRFLVVWQERADGAISDYMKVLGLRIGVDGTVLDAAPFVICDADTGTLSPEPTPSAAGVDGTFLVAWTDARFSEDYPDIYAARIDGATGALDVPNGFVVAASDVDLGGVRVASDGTGFLAVWEQDESDSSSAHEDVVAASVSPEDGAVSAPVTVCGVPWQKSWRPRVAGGPSGYLVVWADDRETEDWPGDAWGTVVDGASLTVLTPDGAPIGGDLAIASVPRDIAAVGADFAVLLREIGCSPGPVFDDLRVTLVGGDDGVPVEGDPIPLWEVDSAEAQTIATVSDDTIAVLGVRYYSPRTQAILSRVDLGAGGSLDPEGIHLSPGINHQFSMTAAGGEASALVAWADTREIAEGTSSDIYAQRVVRDGTALVPLDAHPLRVSFDSENEGDPVVASTGGRFLVAWLARSSPSVSGELCAYEIRAARIDEGTGALLDPEPLLLAGADSAREPPVVAGLGGRFLVAWADEEEDAIFGAMVDAASGEVDDLGGAPLFNTAAGASLALAAGGDAFWLVWSDWRNSSGFWVDGGDFLFPSCLATMNIDLFGGRVDAATGEVAEPDGVALVESWEDKSDAQLLSGGGGLWMWWREYTEISFLCWPDITDVYSATLPPDALYDLPGQPVMSWTPLSERVLATTGAEHLSAWYSSDDAAFLAMRHLGIDGSQLDDPPLSLPIPAETLVALDVAAVGDPGGYIFFWEGWSPADATFRLYGLAVALPECVIDEEAFPSGAEQSESGCLRCVPAVDTTAWTPLPAGAPCDDGDAATLDDQCTAEGLCVGTPVEPDGGSDSDSDADSDVDSDSDADTDTDSSGDGGTAPDASGWDVSAASPGCECAVSGAPSPRRGALVALFNMMI